jgi:type IV secretion system protein VirB7
MKHARLAVAALALLATGCTTAGPFVTSISSDGRGGLIVEKSMVKYNSFMGTVSNENTTTTTIKLVDREALERAIATPAPAQPPQAWTGGKTN